MNSKTFKIRMLISAFFILPGLIFGFAGEAVSENGSAYSNAFTFVQISDLHLCGAGDAENFHLDFDPIATFEWILEEIEDMGEFIVNTGDIVLYGDYVTIENISGSWWKEGSYNPRYYLVTVGNQVSYEWVPIGLIPR